MLNPTAQPITQPELDLKETIGIGKLRGFWKLMTGFRGKYLVSTVSMGVAAIMNTVTFLLLAAFVDHFMVAGDRTVPLAVYVAGFLGLAIIQAGATFNSRRLAAKTAEGIARRIREYIYDHIQRLSFTYHDKTQTGELIQRATSDIDTIRRFFADQAIEAGRIVMLFVVNFIAIYLLDWRLAWFSIIIVPIVMAISLFFFRRVEKAYEAYQTQEAKLSSTLQENLSGVRVVKAFARQEYEENKFDVENQEKYRRGRYLLLMHALFWPITDIMCAAQMLGGFLFAGWLTINGEITVGTYVAYAGLVVWIIWPLRNLGRLIVQMSESLVSFGRISEVVKEEREPVSEGSVRTDQPV
ncbi:MAG TPA: ABC transporter ATP-binding protein, partial [Chloroflexi bacterium]|nr:ABC transporter ATP-binding protein [Chloroflexota bacterium]